MKFEVALLGAAAVGKTSIVRRFSSGGFLDDYEPTVEDYHTRALHYKRRVILLSITDVSGCYQFPAMRKLTIQRTEAFVIVFSVENRLSFEETGKLLDDVLGERQNEYIPVMIVGNKNDIGERAVTPDDVKLLMNDKSTANCKMNYIETSAKEDRNISEIFHGLIKLIGVQDNQKSGLFPKHHKLVRAHRKRCTIL